MLTANSTHKAYVPQEGKVIEIVIVSIIDENLPPFPYAVYRYNIMGRWYYQIDFLPVVELYIKEANETANQ